MKTSVMSSVIQMNPETLQQLVAEVKETIATDIDFGHQPKRRSFGIVDMWNIRRQGKTALSRIKRDF